MTSAATGLPAIALGILALGMPAGRDPANEERFDEGLVRVHTGIAAEA